MEEVTYRTQDALLCSEEERSDILSVIKMTRLEFGLTA
jgi:hypothetical protein